MNRSAQRTFVSTVPMLLGLGALTGGASAQQARPLREQMPGVWTVVSSDTIRPDGTRVPTFGPNPKGLLIFDANGRYMLQLVRSGNPRFVSGNRMEGTAEENKAVVQGSLAHFGTYSVDEAERTFAFPHRGQLVSELGRRRPEASVDDRG